MDKKCTAALWSGEVSDGLYVLQPYGLDVYSGTCEGYWGH